MVNLPLIVPDLCDMDINSNIYMYCYGTCISLKRINDYMCSIAHDNVILWCMYVCVYVCVHVRVSVYGSVCPQLSVSLSVYVCNIARV